MRVFKFGGASVKNAEAIKNVGEILRLFSDEKLVIVISAMGKTTNCLEKIVEAYFNDHKNQKLISDLINESWEFHKVILEALSLGPTVAVYEEIKALFNGLNLNYSRLPVNNYDYIYDQLVSLGEVISTKIVQDYIQRIGIQSKWFDARDLIRTDDTYREGKIDWDITSDLIGKSIGQYLNNEQGNVAIIQGFIGHTKDSHTTTLGREGSDFTGAIMAYTLNAKDLTIWKDVPGMLNADPKWFDDTVKLDKISYREAIELSYYGASIIHPKTIKPMKNKSIPLFVKSFYAPRQDGTVIQESTVNDTLIPSFIFKMNQVLISISPKDFSFIVEENLRDIFNLLNQYKVRVNLMQNSAISFAICANNDQSKITGLIDELKNSFNVKSNECLELVTIRHYDQATINRVTINKEIFIEQKSKDTVRLAMKEL